MTVLSDALKHDIQAGYRAFLKTHAFRPRLGQKQMIGQIAAFLGALEDQSHSPAEIANRVLAIEAGTGTGKTAAYLLSVLPLARAVEKKVVIATGTVALQSQLVDRDIPDVMAATGWKFKYAMAKGRQRYLCPLRLRQCRDAVAANDAGLPLYEDEIPLLIGADTAIILEQMSTQLGQGEWNGDRDYWPEAIPAEIWRALSIDSSQCAGYRCRMFAECCFYQARDSMEEADCIVTNHDLLLADLTLGGGAILPEPENCIYVIDEAHKFGNSALDHFAHFTRLNTTSLWLEQIQKPLSALTVLLNKVGGVESLTGACLDIAEQLRPQMQQCVPIFEALIDDASENNGSHRFRYGEITADLNILCERLAGFFTGLHDSLNDLHRVLERSMDNSAGDVSRVDIEQYYQLIGQWLGRAMVNAQCWSAMSLSATGQQPLAKWLTRVDSGDVQVSVSPLTAGPELEELLWSRCHGALLTSATLRSLGSFRRFFRDLGVSENTYCRLVPDAFDYFNAAVLSVPDFATDGGQMYLHTEALCKNLPRVLGADEALEKMTIPVPANEPQPTGSLVLFASRRQMDEVADAVRGRVSCQILVQGELPVSEIVTQHRQTIDKGLDSVIFGLASFAEGMDLPGSYCRHVVIAKLPFAVPDDPLQAALSEWIESQGGNAFRELSLPDASLRLIQACGRLLRNESDTGRITILDRRLVSKAYGRQLLDSLPPFRRLLADDELNMSTPD